MILGNQWQNKSSYHNNKTSESTVVFSMSVSPAIPIFMRFGDVDIFSQNFGKFYIFLNIKKYEVYVRHVYDSKKISGHAGVFKFKKN